MAFDSFGQAVPLKMKNAHRLKDSFYNFSSSKNRKPGLIETDDGKEFLGRMFIDFEIGKNEKIWSLCSNKSSVC